MPQLRHILVCEETSYLNSFHLNKVEIFEVYFQNNFSLCDRILSMIVYYIYIAHLGTCVHTHFYMCVNIYTHVYVILCNQDLNNVMVWI